MPVDVTVFCGQVVTGNLTEDLTVSLALAVVIVPFSKEYFFWTVYLFWNVIKARGHGRLSSLRLPPPQFHVNLPLL